MDLDILPLLVAPESFCPSISWNLNYMLSTIPIKYEANSNPSDWKSSGTALQWILSTRSPVRNKSLILPSQLL